MGSQERNRKNCSKNCRRQGTLPQKVWEQGTLAIKSGKIGNKEPRPKRCGEQGTPSKKMPGTGNIGHKTVGNREQWPQKRGNKEH